MSSIRRVVVDSIDDIRVEAVDAPQAGPGEVTVRSTVVGICGSDMHAAHGRHPFMSLPFWPGHEVVGAVSAVGDGVDPSLVGRRVVIEPNLACGHCDQCRAGRYNICATLDVFGCQTPGGMTDEFAIAADRVIALPDDLDDDWAALVEPFSTPVHAVRRAGDLSGKRVVVIGAGPIGLFAAIAALDAGASRVVVADLLESKRARAERLGAHGSFDSSAPDAADRARELLGGPAHVVVDCVSRESTVALAIAALDKGGMLMTVGVPAGRTLVDLDLVQDRELTLVGNLMYVREDVLHAIELLRRKPFALDEIVTGTFDLDEADRAFAASDDPEQVKILIRVRSSA
ncbi:zinc-dependent alcohol dehydrogenase [Frigoribacterium faeni]|uniref:2-desacetyl-2-hydroxyethyl bacteriochlorophyllide A dehydrogenase n=1 Tax=Frigoribacterium faeni TaxID=145483 RepID=A0A7W3JK80_9MICO|nr:alcohol dehydrogenase catalytic domain-containing protein [Frigoribacterium faeni]MBA8814321.1 2-desacetyl-2-hydroxyethyl bacteriochlorophyllide A dehydrogenase [Frigoribacterium faeni]BFF12751.1 alcohol dehydrogenase catalytic domain-containing protein [Microbacterium flavescens]GEK83261.1 alcohol dehydrogenase [Frigoribacterium faeni]